MRMHQFERDGTRRLVRFKDVFEQQDRYRAVAVSFRFRRFALKRKRQAKVELPA